MKQEIPKKVEDSKKLEDLSKEDFTIELAKFQEALKSDAFKDVDAYDTLGLEAPKPEPTATEKQKVINQETVERLLPAYEKSREELIAAGYEFKTSDSKMSDGEKEIHARLEKQAVAKFGEKKDEISKIDEDFDMTAIEALDITTDDKVAVAQVIKEAVSRNSESVAKIKGELDGVTSELQEVKMSSPQTKESKDQSGDDLVKSAMAKFGLKAEEKDKETTE